RFFASSSLVAGFLAASISSLNNSFTTRAARSWAAASGTGTVIDASSAGAAGAAFATLAQNNANAEAANSVEFTNLIIRKSRRVLKTAARCRCDRLRFASEPANEAVTKLPEPATSDLRTPTSALGRHAQRA